MGGGMIEIYNIYPCRQDIAAYFAPEVEEFGHFDMNLFMAIQDVLEMMIVRVVKERESTPSRETTDKASPLSRDIYFPICLSYGDNYKIKEEMVKRWKKVRGK